MKRYIVCFIACMQLSHGEDVTLVAESQANQPGFSQTITLNQGDSARVTFAYDANNSNLYLVCNIESKTFAILTNVVVGTNSFGINPVAIAGPATLTLKRNGGEGAGLTTLSITRSGIASPPAAIPQEADTTWNVILESSSDLINWTPANPGQYSGTEPKRFFRTRMVKKP